MDLEIFEHISAFLEYYEGRKDVYKLIAEEVKDFFDAQVFPESEYEINMSYRIKSVDSIREKLIRNNYVVKKGAQEELLQNFQDILGFRIECKFIEEEAPAFALLESLFTKTEDDTFYYMPSMPKIRLNLIDKQPQMQKNGFEIFKIDGMYMLGKECVRFELQIKALVNVFWGEIEHRVVYKNNDYLLADTFISDLLTSIKQNLNMIDSQLYVLYNRFKHQHTGTTIETEEAKARSIEIFVANMVYETYDQMMMEQMGFTIDFKASCDAVVRYLMDFNRAEDMEDYGRMMLHIFNALNGVRETVRVDKQIEFEHGLKYEDEFTKSLIQTTEKLINVNYRWHLHFTILFSLTGDNNAESLENCIGFFRDALCANRSFQWMYQFGIDDAEHIQWDVMMCIADVVSANKKIEYFCATGMSQVHRAINYAIPQILAEISEGKAWDDIKEDALNNLEQSLQI